MMKVYKGIVKGNTVILEEKPDLPDECPALVEIKPIDKARDEEIARKHTVAAGIPKDRRPTSGQMKR